MLLMMKINNAQIDDIVSHIHDKYLSYRVNPHKIMQNIMQEESIKYREIANVNSNFCGIYTKAPNGTKYIIINSDISNAGRKNFTIAHELGHHYLNHELEGYCIISESDSTKSPQEKQADYFASIFLMPTDKINSAVKSIYANVKKARIYNNMLVVSEYVYKSVYEPLIQDKLTKRYGVSAEALRYRLQNLNLIRWNI